MLDNGTDKSLPTAVIYHTLCTDPMGIKFKYLDNLTFAKENLICKQEWGRNFSCERFPIPVALTFLEKL